MSQPEWLSIKEYALAYNVHRNTVAKWREHGLLETWQTQHTVRIRNQPPFAHSTKVDVKSHVRPTTHT